MLQHILMRLGEAVDAPFQVIGAAFTAAICVYAMTQGDRTERFAGAVFAAAYLASVFAQDVSDWVGPQIAVFGIDLIMMAVIFGLALRTDRTWALFAAAFHLLAVLAHVAMMLDPRLQATAYAILLNVLAHMIFVALALGTWDATRRRRSAAAAESQAA